MANTEIVDSLVSSTALEQLSKLDTAVANSYKEMGILLTKASELQTTLSKMGISFSQVNDAIQQSNNVEKEAAATVEKINKDSQERARIIQVEVARINERRQVMLKDLQVSEKTLEIIDLINGNLSTNTELYVRLKKELKDLAEQRKKVQQEEEKGIISSKEAHDLLVEITLQENELKKGIQEVSQTMNNQQKIANAAAGSYDKVRLQLEQMRIAYRKMTDEEKESEAGKELFDTIVQFDDAVKASAGSIGNFQANVGDYKKGLTDIGKFTAMINPQLGAMVTKVTSVTFVKDLWTKANIKLAASLNLTAKASKVLMLTGVGLLIAGILAVVSAVKSWMDTQKKITAVLSEANSEMGAEILKINGLFDALKNAKEGTEEYYKAKKAIISQYGDYLKNLSYEVSSLHDIESAYNAITRAAMTAAKSRAIEKITEEESDKFLKNISREMQALYNSYISKFGEEGADKYNKLISTLLSGDKLSDEMQKDIDSFVKHIAGKSVQQIFVDKIASGYKQLQQEITKYQKLIPEIKPVEGDKDIDFAIERAKIEAQIAENKQKILAMQKDETKGNIQNIADLIEENNLLKQRYDLMNPVDEKEEAKERKEEVKQRKDDAKERQAAIEEEIKQTQVLADEQKRIYENEENDTETRLSALMSYYERRQEIIDLGAKKEASANEVSNQELLYIEADRQRASTVLEQAKQDEILNIIKQAQAEQYKQAQAIGEDLDQLRQVELGDLLRDFTKQVEANMGNKAALLSLEEQYQQKKKAIIDKYNNMALDSEIEYLTNLLAATENNLQLQEQIYARLADLRKQLSENAFSSAEDSTVNTVKQATGKGRKSNKTKDFNDVIFGLDPNTTSESGESEYRAAKANAEKQMDIYTDLWSSATDMMNDYYDQQIQRIDEEEKREREAYEESLKNIDEKYEQGILSEEQADAQRRIIEETWLQKEKEFDAQRREMQLKQAKWEKAEAIVQAG
ncbi:MAG: hypothetical protein LBS54_04090, partial [Dysgonamonadaceae bacterium]|nr:hypothetical protein [Dysgonamonadaceae bacterium]